VFLKPCGCVACLILNVPRNFAALAKAQRYAKSHNETYQLMETQAVREMEWQCTGHSEKLKAIPHLMGLEG